MNLSRRTLLSLNAHRFQASTWDGKEISSERDFDDTQEGREEFAAYLQQHPEPAYLLVDVIEEDFRQESVPHLTGRNRRELVARKLEQYYRDTPFRLAKTQYRHTQGRRDDEMLFSSLTNPQHLSPWLDTLSQARIPLIGIYSLPHVSCHLLQGIKSDHVLLLSWEKHAGLRQSYFHHKRLRLSRLTPLNEQDSFGDAIANETPRMLHYLNSMNLPPQDEVLDVHIICHANDKVRLENKMRERLDMPCVCLDMQALGNSIKTGVIYQDSDAAPLILNVLARKAPSYHYANHPYTRYYPLWQLRWTLLLLATAIALTGMIWSGISLWQAHHHATKIQPLLAQAAQLTRQTAEIKQRFPHTSVSATDMKAAVTAVRKLEKYFPPPETILFELADMLDQFTRIHLQKMGWHSEIAHTIDIDGELIGFGSDYRSALAYLEDFRLALAQHGYTVTAQKMPLDITPQASIHRDMQNASEQTARFALKLVRDKHDDI